MATSSRPRKAPIELGDSGVQIFNGIINGEEYRWDLRGRMAIQTYDEMRRGDATCHAGLLAVKMPIISANFYAEAGGDGDQDEQAQELLDYNFTELLNWNAVLGEMLTMLEFGFYVAELVFGWATVNGVERVVLVKIAYRKQTTIERWTQADGTPGIVQRKSDGTTVSIPDDKLIILTHQQEGDNYEGISILRSAYQNWYYKKTLYQIDAVKHERQALGVVKIKLPNNAKQTDRDLAKRAAMNIRANEQAYIEEPEGYDINFMDMQASTTSDPKESIAHHDRQILKNMAVQYLDIGSAGSSGSFAASTDQRALLEQQDQAIAEQIAARINEKVVKTLIDLNFNVTEYPKWKVGRIGEENVEEITTAVQKMVDAGVITPTDEDEEHTRRLIRYPDMPEEVKGQERKKDAPAKDVADQPDKNAVVDDKTDSNKPDEDVKASAKSRAVAASISSRDIPGLYDGTGVDPDDLGCIMMDVEKLDVLKHVPQDYHGELIDATSRHDHAMGAVAEKEAHVTLLYGLLENGNVWKDKVDAVLDGWKLPNVTIGEVGYFETPDSFAVVAHVETTPELVDGHERLTLLPHIQTFSEYKPHITLAYVSKDADIDDWVNYLDTAYNGKTVGTKGINYGDQPEGGKKVDASELINTARQLRAAITGELYGPLAAA